MEGTSFLFSGDEEGERESGGREEDGTFFSGFFMQQKATGYRTSSHKLFIFRILNVWTKTGNLGNFSSEKAVLVRFKLFVGCGCYNYRFLCLLQ